MRPIHLVFLLILVLIGYIIGVKFPGPGTKYIPGLS